MVVHDRGVEVAPQYEEFLRMEGMKGSKGERRPLPWDIVAATEAMRNERNKENIVSVEEGSDPSRGLLFKLPSVLPSGLRLCLPTQEIQSRLGFNKKRT